MLHANSSDLESVNIWSGHHVFGGFTVSQVAQVGFRVCFCCCLQSESRNVLKSWFSPNLSKHCAFLFDFSRRDGRDDQIATGTERHLSSVVRNHRGSLMKTGPRFEEDRSRVRASRLQLSPEVTWDLFWLQTALGKIHTRFSLTFWANSAYFPELKISKCACSSSLRVNKI